MSRFERRLKPKANVVSRRQSSPRPGSANCKLNTGKKTKMLSGFIEVAEKNNENKPLIQEVKASNLLELEDDALEKTMKINNTLKETIVNTRNPTLKRLLVHELRLNTLEINLDCLTDLKCSEISEQQTINQEKKNIDETIRKVSTFDEKIEKLMQENIEFKKLFSELNQYQATNLESIDQNKTEISEKFNIINELENNLKIITDNYVNNEKIEDIYHLFRKVESENNLLKKENKLMEEKIKKIEEVLNTLIERLMDPNLEKYDDILDILN